MATALAVYVTNQNLAGLTATAYGVGTATINVGGNGAAFGVANYATMSVLDLLLAIDAQSHNCLLFDLNGDGQITGTEATRTCWRRRSWKTCRTPWSSSPRSPMHYGHRSAKYQSNPRHNTCW